MDPIRMIRRTFLKFSEQSKITVLEIRFYNGFGRVWMDFSYILVTFDIFNIISSNLCLIQSIMSLACIKSHKCAQMSNPVFQNGCKNFGDLTILLLETIPRDWLF